MDHHQQQAKQAERITQRLRALGIWLPKRGPCLTGLRFLNHRAADKRTDTTADTRKERHRLANQIVDNLQLKKGNELDTLRALADDFENVAVRCRPDVFKFNTQNKIAVIPNVQGVRYTADIDLEPAVAPVVPQPEHPAADAIELPCLPSYAAPLSQPLQHAVRPGAVAASATELEGQLYLVVGPLALDEVTAQVARAAGAYEFEGQVYFMVAANGASTPEDKLAEPEHDSSDAMHRVEEDSFMDMLCGIGVPQGNHTAQCTHHDNASQQPVENHVAANCRDQADSCLLMSEQPF
eukprot:TRINITY_DN11122_c0_g1_i1.p1 TRINITY_DN11122_c0_g1~~TRINITY_DN11122_c0_g1_i1.p1  ORF type:complete len:295 (+),score=45.84 TRINITY_DN11122_c0_g1_i1:194-1078(+)